MRIVSLLPSATESLFALGLGGSVVAVTHECDYPPEASLLPIVTRSTLQLHDKDSAGIEIAVSEAAVAGRSLYFVDTHAIQDLEPDLVVAQDVCRVCAVSADQVAVDLDGTRIIRIPSRSAATWSAETAQTRHTSCATTRSGFKSSIAWVSTK